MNGTKIEIQQAIALHWRGTMHGTLDFLGWPCSYQTAYDWRDKDTYFQGLLARSEKATGDKLEQHLIDNAMEAGVNNNQTLGMFLLGGMKPAKYRPNTTTAEDTAIAVLDKLKELGRKDIDQSIDSESDLPSKALTSGGGE